MKLKVLAAVCAMVATNVFAIPTVANLEDGMWNFNGNKVAIGVNTDHFDFSGLEAGNYWANFAGSSTGHVSFTVESVKLNGSLMTVQAGSDDYFGKSSFGFTLPMITLGEMFSLDITYQALNSGNQAVGKPLGSYKGTVTITQAVPEPQTYALVLAGLGAMCFIGSRRRPR